MNSEFICVDGRTLRVFTLNTAIVGSGAAGLNAADRLYSFGQKDIAVITEGMRKGTSRNTGSDKQTYYKLTLAGSTTDSVHEMAKTLFEGGSMDGDIALVEAALSPRCFYRLVDIGVPFPHNKSGEYVGYKTDHDPRQRATSAGPLTSKIMTEQLEKQINQRDIKIFDGFQVVKILTDNHERCLGLLALDLNNLEDPQKRYAMFNCTNVIYATGGPAGMYSGSVYPTSQYGASGIAFEAGVEGTNLSESQFGLSSTKFRWNVSGTYQQVLPRYVSTNRDGSDEKEFLNEYFQNPGQILDAIFLKGYQWPFDPRKIKHYGSSLIDILVYHETVIKRRRVYLDYTRNPQIAEKNGAMDFSLLGKESYQYLLNSNALFGKPIDRLAHMNMPAIELYKSHGIDVISEYLEVAVCAQHNNGGLRGDIWWQSNLRNFFPVGEVNGTHGVYRPGGSALNSGQVGSTRAAEYVVARCQGESSSLADFIDKVKNQVIEILKIEAAFMSNSSRGLSPADITKNIGDRMMGSGAIIRKLDKVTEDKEAVYNDLQKVAQNTQISTINELPIAFRNKDILLSQYVYLSSIEDYILKGGKSRGSYLIYDKAGQKPLEVLPEDFRFSLDPGDLMKQKQITKLKKAQVCNNWIPVKPIPDEDYWFENVWNDYRKGACL